MKIRINENGLFALLEVTDQMDLRLLSLSDAAVNQHVKDLPPEIANNQRLVEVKFSGENTVKHHGPRQVGTLPGYRLKYVTHIESNNADGKRIEFQLRDPVRQARVSVFWQFYNGVKVIRTWTCVTNDSDQDIGLESVSSFYLANLDHDGLLPRNEKMVIHEPHSSWSNEGMWKANSLRDLGFYSEEIASSNRIFGSNTGTWSSHELMPMAVLENREDHSYTAWQIENHGSWYWEISGVRDLMYLELTGPNDRQNQWYKVLHPGETFTTITTAVAFASGSMDATIQELTKYRRRIRRPNKDNERLGVIFNDYMNSLWGNPTTKRELPLIDAAAAAGCEYYCIDAGWYAPGEWWDGVGEWLPSKERFPEGIRYLTDKIRAKGMIPGLWLEIEVMGVNSPLVDQVPTSWFFQRHGQPVIDRDRYQLDFRNPEVQAFASEVIARLVNEYGVGYIKMDYNIDAGAGTDFQADSLGDGLLEHDRAYVAWLQTQFKQYPDLIIENCSSGGMREDYDLLAQHSIQSTSDQEDYRMTGAIAGSAAAVLTPEQAAVWSYPLRSGDINEVVFNMTNAMLLRIHQSGHLAELSPERFAMVKEGITTYKETIRPHIPTSLPFWPLGRTPVFEDQWYAFGLKDSAQSFIAVWKKNPTQETLTLNLPQYVGQAVDVKLVFPQQWQCQTRWEQGTGQLQVHFDGVNTARILTIVPHIDD